MQFKIDWGGSSYFIRNWGRANVEGTHWPTTMAYLLCLPNRIGYGRSRTNRLGPNYDKVALHKDLKANKFGPRRANIVICGEIVYRRFLRLKIYRSRPPIILCTPLKFIIYHPHNSHLWKFQYSLRESSSSDGIGVSQS